jgi:hypothetical protein
VHPFRRIAQAFIMTFGITQPGPEREGIATVFIISILVGTIVAVAAIAAFLLMPSMATERNLRALAQLSEARPEGWPPGAPAKPAAES